MLSTELNKEGEKMLPTEAQVPLNIHQYAHSIIAFP